jgi:DNA-binding MurR/RpiR family transcriptional regulator
MKADNRGNATLQERFDRHKSELSRSELAVAEYLLGQPIEVLIFQSAEDIAAESGTSDATVIRATRRLGFSGLPELKRICSRPMVISVPTTERLSQRFRATGDDLNVITRRIFSTAREIISSTEEKLEPDALAKAIQVLEGADTVWCLGMGRSETAALHCSIALSRVGLRSRHSGASGFDLANRLIDLREGDAVILFHAVKDTAEFKLVVDRTPQLGCNVVLVCGSQLAERYRGRTAATLVCVGAAAGLSSWTIGAIAISDILAYGIATRGKDRALATRKRLADLRGDVPNA